MVKSKERKSSLDDETLTTPEHDKMILDLLNVDYVRNLLSDYIQQKLKYSKDIHISYWTQEGRYGTDNAVFRSTDKQLVFDSGLHAYKDDVIEWVSAHQKDIESLMEQRLNISISSEVPIVRSGRSIVGYWDILVHLESPKRHFEGLRKYQYFREDKVEKSYISLSLGKVDEYIFIEVKPKVLSFGTTLRQLNKYVEYGNADKCNVYLYTPDTTFKDAFEGQGFKVLTPLVEE